MKNTAVLLLIFSFFAAGCGDDAAKEEAKAVKKFFAGFQAVEFPYSIITDAANHTVFHNLMVENNLIDSASVTKFALNREKNQIDSVHEPIKTEATGWNYYTIGSLSRKEKYTAVLYGRNILPDENDAQVFLATFSPEGKKIDEVVFHKPLLVMPPTEIRRITEAQNDSSFTVISVMEEHKFVEKEVEYMELVRQIAYEKNYTIDSEGKITLTSEDRKELSAKEVEAKADSLSVEQ